MGPVFVHRVCESVIVGDLGKLENFLDGVSQGVMIVVVDGLETALM